MNKYWKIDDNGRMVRKHPHIPTVTRTETNTAAGLTISCNVSKSYTFTVAQLKRACTAHNLNAFPISRDAVNDLLKSIVKQHRYELFNSYESYTITTNGYGQLKSMGLKDGGRQLAPNEIFNILETACN